MLCLQVPVYTCDSAGLYISFAVFSYTTMDYGNNTIPEPARKVFGERCPKGIFAIYLDPSHPKG